MKIVQIILVLAISTLSIISEASMKEKFNVVSINLEIEGKQDLFVLIAKDGTVNRLGTGAINNQDNDLYIGKSEEELFEMFMTNVNKGIFNHQGIYDVPDKKGKKCTLTLIFADTTTNKEAGFQFIYGSESQGPPGEITEMVIRSVELTAPWLEEQKKIANANEQNA